MRKQQQIWQMEHKTASSIPSEMTKNSYQQPSSYVVAFYDYIKEIGITSGRAVDIGAGKGRNSIFLAKKGFIVDALDYIDEAVAFIKTTSKLENLEGKIRTHCISIDDVWPFPENYFDITIDCFASIDIETKQGREKCKNELLRTLKPGGYALVVVVSSDDEIEHELITNHPGKEKNSSIWPMNNKFQKNYDEKELQDFYGDFTIINLKKIQKKTHKLGKDFTTSVFWLVLKKI